MSPRDQPTYGTTTSKNSNSTTRHHLRPASSVPHGTTSFDDTGEVQKEPPGPCRPLPTLYARRSDPSQPPPLARKHTHSPPIVASFFLGLSREPLQDLRRHWRVGLAVLVRAGRGPLLRVRATPHRCLELVLPREADEVRGDVGEAYEEASGLAFGELRGGEHVR